MKANPDDFVLLIPNEFGPDVAELLVETHVEFWQEELGVEIGTTGGSFDMPEATLRLVIDPAIPEILSLAGTSIEPFGASDIALLDRHTQVYRLAARGMAAAWPLVRLSSTMIEAGASAVVLPGIRQVHPPGVVRRLAMSPSPDSLANFFVSAFDGEGWMRTRGLTPFGLPEVETEVVDGLNAAYFRLMDVAAAMITNGRRFDEHSSLAIGPHTHTLTTGPHSALVDEIPINGLHGVQTLR